MRDLVQECSGLQWRPLTIGLIQAIFLKLIVFLLLGTWNPRSSRPHLQIRFTARSPSAEFGHITPCALGLGTAGGLVEGPCQNGWGPSSYWYFVSTARLTHHSKQIQPGWEGSPLKLSPRDLRLPTTSQPACNLTFSAKPAHPSLCRLFLGVCCSGSGSSFDPGHRKSEPRDRQLKMINEVRHCQKDAGPPPSLVRGHTSA
jgi:hypothetical protein